MTGEKEKSVMLGGAITDEQRARLTRHLTAPEYVRLIEAMVEALTQWKRERPWAVLLWQALPPRTLITGDPRSDESLGILAANDMAKAALRYADERTGHKATLMTMQLALRGLGWIPS